MRHCVCMHECAYTHTHTFTRTYTYTQVQPFTPSVALLLAQQSAIPSIHVNHTYVPSISQGKTFKQDKNKRKENEEKEKEGEEEKEKKLRADLLVTDQGVKPCLTEAWSANNLCLKEQLWLLLNHSLLCDRDADEPKWRRGKLADD